MTVLSWSSLSITAAKITRLSSLFFSASQTIGHVTTVSLVETSVNTSFPPVQQALPQGSDEE